MKACSFFCLVYILFATSVAMAETDSKAIIQFSNQLMHMDRMDISCNGKLSEKELSKYYSTDFMKRISKSCEESTNHGIAGSLVYTGFLDGNSPSLCHENPRASSPCYKDYKVIQIHSQDETAEVKVTYNNDEFFYTILKLVRENGQWRLDDVSLIDPNTKGTDYDESRYSIKADLDKAVARINKNKSK